MESPQRTLEDQAVARPDDRWTRRILGVTVGLTTLFVLARLVRRFFSDWFLEPYKAPLFWLDYREGFVRRGLPGEVLSWFSAPTYGAAITAAVVIAAVGAGALLVLAHRTATRAGNALGRLALPGLLLASPFALPLAVRDVGRFDALGIAALVGVAAALARGRATGVVVAALLAAVATASEEFLVLYLVPVVVLGACRLVGRAGPRLAVATGVLLPAMAVAAASSLLRPSASFLAERVAAARAAGVPPADLAGLDSASILRLSLTEQLALFGQYDVPILVVLLVGAVALSNATAWLVWVALGRPAPRAAAAAAAWLALSAAVLSVLGVDFLRWWGLALLAFVTVVSRLRGTSTRPPTADAARPDPRWTRILQIVLVANLLWQVVPIGPPMF